MYRKHQVLLHHADTPLLLSLALLSRLPMPCFGIVADMQLVDAAALQGREPPANKGKQQHTGLLSKVYVSYRRCNSNSLFLLGHLSTTPRCNVMFEQMLYSCDGKNTCAWPKNAAASYPKSAVKAVTVATCLS